MTPFPALLSLSLFFLALPQPTTSTFTPRNIYDLDEQLKQCVIENQAGNCPVLATKAVPTGTGTRLLTDAVTDTNELSFAAAHGLAPGTAVVYDDNSETTIAGLTDDTMYYVLAGTTASEMKLEASLGSGAIAIATGQGASNNKISVAMGPIGDWITTAITDCSFLFVYNKITNGVRQPWALSTQRTFYQQFNGDVGNWDMSNCVTLERAFAGFTRTQMSFNRQLNWNVAKVTNFEGTFLQANAFNNGGQPMNWDTSSAVTLKETFKEATLFNQPLNWDTSQVTTLEGTFRQAYAFNQHLNWDTSQVTTLKYTFMTALTFNNGGQPMNWDTSQVTTLEGTFSQAKLFNGLINNWNTQNVRTLKNTFNQADIFNQPINNWNTNNVVSMETTFWDARKFNQPLNNWDISSVTTLKGTFCKAFEFNGNVSYWDTSNGPDLANTFWNARAFNQPLFWDTSRVTTLYRTFCDANAFNQPLGHWVSFKNFQSRILEKY